MYNYRDRSIDDRTTEGRAIRLAPRAISSFSRFFLPLPFFATPYGTRNRYIRTLTRSRYTQRTHSHIRKNKSLNTARARARVVISSFVFFIFRLGRSAKPPLKLRTSRSLIGKDVCSFFAALSEAGPSWLSEYGSRSSYCTSVVATKVRPKLTKRRITAEGL